MDFFDLFADVPENLVVVSPEYRILAATDAYLAVTMRRRDEIVGKHLLLEAFPEKDIPYEENPVKLALDQTLATKQAQVMDVIRYDLVIPEEEGGGFKELYWETSYIPGLDPDGKVRYLIQKAVNVTEREKAKRDKTLSEIKFSIMTDAVPQIIYTTDEKGQLNFVNQRWVNYTGISAEEAIASENGWASLVHPDDLPQVMARATESFTQGTEFQAELRLRNQEGQYRWFMSKSIPVRLEDNGKIIMWVGSSTDIHSTKQMVQELLESNEQMAALADQVQLAFKKAEAERLTLERLIMEAPAVFCILTGPQHEYTLVNPYYQALFPGKALLHRTVAEALPEVVEQGFIQILDKVYKTGDPFVAKEILIRLDRFSNGQLEDVYMTLNYQPRYNEENNIIGILVFGYDITESVKVRQALQKAKFI